MTKKELIEMLSDVPDDSEIRTVETRQDLLGGWRPHGSGI